jgi:hypothetical protein
MGNRAVGGAAQLVSSPGSGRYHVSAGKVVLRVRASIQVDCEAVHSTRRAADKAAICRACWNYLWYAFG